MFGSLTGTLNIKFLRTFYLELHVGLNIRSIPSRRMCVCLSARGLRVLPPRVTLNSGSKSFVVSQTNFVTGK